MRQKATGCAAGRSLRIAACLVGLGLLTTPAIAQSVEDKPADGPQTLLWEKLVERCNTIAKQGRSAEALETAQASLRIATQAFGPQNAHVAQSEELVAQQYDTMGEHAQAESFYHQARTIREQVFGPTNPSVGATLLNEAASAVARGHADQAEPLYQRAVSIHTQKLAPTDPVRANTLMTVAHFYAMQDRVDQAEPLYQEALALRRKALGTHEGVASTLTILGDFYATHGHADKAAPLYREAVSIRELLLGEDHPAVATSLILLGQFYVSLGDQDRAESCYQRALFIFGKNFSPDNPLVAKTLPATLRGSGFSGRLRGASDADQQMTLQIAESLRNRGIAYAGLGKTQEAALTFSQALKEYEKILGPNDPNLAEVLEPYIALLRQMGAVEQARALETRLRTLRPQ